MAEPPPERDAVSVTVAPTINDPTVTDGVLSLVALSEELDPRSDAVSRSGVPGAPTPAAVSALEIDVAVPLALLATAAYRTYDPTSSPVRTYVAAVAPLIAVQSAGMLVPTALALFVQRYHWCSTVGVGPPLNVADPVRVSPAFGVRSLIAAADVTAGGEAARLPAENEM